MRLTYYFAQTFVVVGLLTTLLRSTPVVLRIQVWLWALSVGFIAWQFGIEEQLDFYSNDQRYYSFVVEMFSHDPLLALREISVVSAKAPYTLPAVVLTLFGIHPTLALKIISLLSLLVLSSLVLNSVDTRSLSRQTRMLYLTGCGAIGLFFSVLALRETSMMLFTYTYAFGKSAQVRILSLVTVYLLRPHLAVALIVAEFVTTIWRWLTSRRNAGYWSVPAIVLSTLTLGGVIFSQTIPAHLEPVPVINSFAIAQMTRFFSNYVGLQFLTVPESTVNFPILTLVLLRILLSETFVVVTVFIVTSILMSFRLRERDVFALAAFSTYVSVVTNTDFNSFRQNIPFVPLMGILLVGMIERDSRRAPAIRLIT
jgi:hypothetical protein